MTNHSATDMPSRKDASERPAPNQGMSSTQLKVEQRFGVLPNFFGLAPENPEITDNLWGFACFAYLDNPLPSLFKERLFVYLSRFCDVRYCITRHVGFLMGLGRASGNAQCSPQTVEEVIRLIRRPFPRGQDLQPLIAQCMACEEPLPEMPAPDSPLELALVACASHVFVQTPDAPSCLEALKHALGESRLQHLLVFLAFIRTAHYWSKVHSELSIEEDLKELLSTHERLAECLFNDPEAGACDFSQQLMTELISLRQDAARHDESLRRQRRQNEARLRTARQQAEKALLASEQEIKRALDYAEATLRTSPVPLLVLENDFRVMTANEAFYDTFKVTAAETQGSLVYELGNGQWNIPKLRNLLECILPHHTVFKNFEVTHDFESLGCRTMLLNARRIENAPDTPERIVLVIEDITELKRADEALRQLNEELEQRVTERTRDLVQSQARLRAMATELNLAEQRERKRLATELHDHLQQSLVLGRLTVGQVQRVGAILPAGSEVMKQIDNIFSEALTYTRTLVADLSPPVLRDHGLPAALKWLGEYMKKHDITVTVTVPKNTALTLPED